MPEAYASLMNALCRGYLSACEMAGRKPDAELLAPITATLDNLASIEPPRASYQTTRDSWSPKRLWLKLLRQRSAR